MKSVQYSSYGEATVLELNDNSPTPALKSGQVLVENYAASVNAIDWKVRAGYMKDMMPVQFPVTIGGDFAGKITRVGEAVTDLKVGDEVFGQAIILNGGSGSMAEFVAANVANTALKPVSTSFEESSALPLAGVSALQALEDHIKLQSGQKILIHGGAGGLGHLAIQIAKALGAYVVTTVNSKHTEFVKSLGADEVIDYKMQKFEEILKDFDAVFDTVGGETTDKSFKILKKGGVIVSMVGQPSSDLATQHGVTAIGQMTQTTTAHLQRLSELVDAGKVKVHVDKIYSLAEVQDAFTFQEKQHPQGKVVVRIKS